MCYFHIDPQTKMDFLDHTISVWQPHTEQPLTREDAREITHNVVGFFGLLREWAEEEAHSAPSVGPMQPTTPNLHDEVQSGPVVAP